MLDFLQCIYYTKCTTESEVIMCPLAQGGQR
nr:MAG TPA: hypothetical protein [Caudoviricetes sp.]DAQ38671.1 MAG TPA: hypothetical protein [Caudoviricetes sp.]